MQFESSHQTENILVLGAGELGMSVLRALAHDSSKPGTTHITVLLRPATSHASDTARASLLDACRKLDVDILYADVIDDSVEKLAAQFRSFDTVVSCVGFVAGTGTQLKLARAALHAGVKRFLPWQFGVDYDVIGKGSAQDLFDEQLDVRALLRAQDTTDWIIISTGMFTSFLFEPLFGVVDLQHNTVRALGSWETQVTVTTPEDIGLLTARILFCEPPFANQVVFTAGDTLTYRALADLVDSKLGRNVSRVLWSVPELVADLAAHPQDSMRKYRAVFAAGVGVAWDKNRTFNAAQNIAVTTVAEWIDRHLTQNPLRQVGSQRGQK